MKKRHQRVWLCVWIIVSAILLSSCSKKYVESILEHTAKSTKVDYEETNRPIIELTNGDEYLNASVETRAELVTEELLSLDGVNSETIAYDDTSKLVTYEYADGTYGGVMLVPFDSESNGTSDAGYQTRVIQNEDGTATFHPWPSVPAFDTEIYPYEENDLRARIICDFGDSGQSSYFWYSEQAAAAWGDTYLETDLVSEATLDHYRTGLSGYDYVVIEQHGMMYQDIPMIVLQKEIDLTSKLVAENGVVYNVLQMLGLDQEPSLIEDCQENRVAVILLKDHSDYSICLMPKFFSHYYGGGGLKDAIVWLGSCNTFENDKLVSAIADCGAKAVIAPTDTVSRAYNFLMLDAFTYKLLGGNTVGSALSFARDTWGENDQVFLKTYFNDDDDTPAEIKLYNGEDETFVTLVPDASNLASDVTFERILSDGYESAVITGRNTEGEIVWEYSTIPYEQTELWRVSEIGRFEDQYYFVRDGEVVALSMSDGTVVWTNSDFVGSGTCAVIGNDAIYLCGQDGPDFYAISFDGETLCRIEQFDERYYWAEEIEVEDKTALVYLHGGTSSFDSPVIFSVDLDTWEYKMKRGDAVALANELYEQKYQVKKIEEVYMDSLKQVVELMDTDIEQLLRNSWISVDFFRLAATIDSPIIWRQEDGRYLVVYPGGCIYVGEMKNDIREGFGKWYVAFEAALDDKNNPNNENYYAIYFEGEWKADYPNGTGTQWSYDEYYDQEIFGNTKLWEICTRTGNLKDGYEDGMIAMMCRWTGSYSDDPEKVTEDYFFYYTVDGIPDKIDDNPHRDDTSYIYAHGQNRQMSRAWNPGKSTPFGVFKAKKAK